jgi:hypothetical protein
MWHIVVPFKTDWNQYRKFDRGQIETIHAASQGSPQKKSDWPH